FTSSTANNDPENNVNNDDNGTVTGTLGQTGGFIVSGPIILAVGTEPTDDGDTSADTNLSLDFGVVTTAAGTLSLGDTVWNDANNDGLLNNGETGMQGVVVELLGPTGTTVWQTVTTDAYGKF